MVFSVIHTHETGTTIWRLKTDRVVRGCFTLPPDPATPLLQALHLTGKVDITQPLEVLSVESVEH